MLSAVVFRFARFIPASQTWTFAQRWRTCLCPRMDASPHRAISTRCPPLPVFSFASTALIPRLFCPRSEFLAIATISSPSLTLSHPPNLTGSKTSSIIQIWSLLTPHPEQSLAVETAEGEVEEPEKMRFEMGVLIGEGEGEARDLQWCPRGGVAPSARSGHAMEIDQSKSSTAENSLGVLAGVFTDGKIKIFVVANPRTVRERQGKAETETVYGRSPSCALSG